MPSYRVGGGIEGAATTLLEHVQRQTKRREDEEDELRKWHRRVQEIVLTHGEKYNDQFVSAILSGQSSGPADWLSQQRQRIDQTLPQGPFVRGPSGGAIGGESVEALPGTTLPREEVVQGQMPSLLKPQMEQIYRMDASGRPAYASSVPEGSRVVTSGNQDPLTQLFLSGQGAGGVQEEALRQQAMEELVAAGMPLTEANIQEAMRQLSQQGSALPQ